MAVMGGMRKSSIAHGGSLIDERQKILQEYLQELALIPAIKESCHFKQFIAIDEHFPEFCSDYEQPTHGLTPTQQQPNNTNGFSFKIMSDLLGQKLTQPIQQHIKNEIAPEPKALPVKTTNLQTTTFGSQNSKKQTTTKKSRYDDSYLSENATPTKQLDNVKQNTFEIPEDEEKSASSYSQRIIQSQQNNNNLNFHNHPGSVHMRQQSHIDIIEGGNMFDSSHLRESINSTSTLGRQQVPDEESQILEGGAGEVFIDRTNMVVNPTKQQRKPTVNSPPNELLKSKGNSRILDELVKDSHVLRKDAYLSKPLPQSSISHKVSNSSVIPSQQQSSSATQRAMANSHVAGSNTQSKQRLESFVTPRKDTLVFNQSNQVGAARPQSSKVSEQQYKR